MDRVIGEAHEQAVSYGMQGTVCSCSFSVAKCCCFMFSLTVLLSHCLTEVEGTQTIYYFRPVLRLVSHIGVAIIWQRVQFGQLGSLLCDCL